MYPDFAFTKDMQVVLAIFVVSELFVCLYFLAELLLRALELPLKRKQQVLFSVIVGVAAQSVLAYSVICAGGLARFSTLVYYFLVTPNPLHGLLFFFAAETLLGVSKVRSVKAMCYAYMVWLISFVVNRLVGAVLFPQDEAHYNYLAGIYQQIFCLALFLVFIVLFRRVLKQTRFIWQLSDVMFFSKGKEMVIFLSKATAAYAGTIILPLVIPEPIVVYTVQLVFLLLFGFLNIAYDIILYDRQTIRRHELHISALFKGIEELRGLKHDFNNVLHTYSGFLELKEYEGLEKYNASLIAATSSAGTLVELGEKAPENPAIISLLIDKLEYAEKRNVKLILSLGCNLKDMYIDDADLTLVLGCLLDYAIDVSSKSEMRKAHISIESKNGYKKLIIVGSNLPMPESADVHITEAQQADIENAEKGIIVIRGVLSKYDNCSFQMKSSAQDLSAYIELTPR